MKNLIASVLLLLTIIIAGNAQTAFRGNNNSFIDYQKTFPHPDESFRRKEDTLMKQFAEKKLVWPAKYIYIRSFKYDSKMEVWVKQDLKDPFKLFKTYKICALAGALGPKRMEGDFQVPEGFYYINEFNPRSQYYLSLGINYPNESDRLLSDSIKPGNSIYIHGSCVTVGCIPITDEQIDELYVLAAHARSEGQDFIPVHIFPIRYNVARSLNYLNSMTKDDPELKKFSARLQEAFDYFEKYRQLPIIMTTGRGEYIVNGMTNRKPVDEKPVKKEPVIHRTRNITGLVDAVHQWPEFPGGGEAFNRYLDQVGKDMVDLLPEGMTKAYVQLEFIVDRDGTPTNFKVLRGMKDDDFNDELINRLEKMPTWSPAILHDKPVPKKMVQTVTVQVE